MTPPTREDMIEAIGLGFKYDLERLETMLNDGANMEDTKKALKEASEKLKLLSQAAQAGSISVEYFAEELDKFSKLERAYRIEANSLRRKTIQKELKRAKEEQETNPLLKWLETK
jgi:hypothetical protein